MRVPHYGKLRITDYLAEGQAHYSRSRAHPDAVLRFRIAEALEWARENVPGKLRPRDFDSRIELFGNNDPAIENAKNPLRIYIETLCAAHGLTASCPIDAMNRDDDERKANYIASSARSLLRALPTSILNRVSTDAAVSSEVDRASGKKFRGRRGNW